MSKTFVITMMGRFGNNLSQIALGKYLSILGNTVSYDISQLGDDPQILKIASISDYLLPLVKVSRKSLPSLDGRFAILGRLVRRFMYPFKIIEETGSELPAQFETIPSAWLHGYWQETRFSKILASELQLDFCTKQSENVIRVHVRRGDYIENPAYLSDNYYISALKQIKSEERFANLNIEIISDQPELCFGKFDVPLTEVSYLPLGDPIADFKKLATARVLVCSRSSFSWWAGLISSGTVYYPYNWPLGKDAQGANLPSEWTPTNTNF